MTFSVYKLLLSQIMGSLGEKCVSWGNVVKGESPYSNPPSLLASFLRRSASWLGAPLLCAFLPGSRILLREASACTKNAACPCSSASKALALRLLWHASKCQSCSCRALRAQGLAAGCCGRQQLGGLTPRKRYPDEKCKDRSETRYA